MANYTHYITTEGQRWDSVAYDAYGDLSRINDIIAANSDVPMDDILPGGIRLQIPIVEEEERSIESLPPWKR